MAVVYAIFSILLAGIPATSQTAPTLIEEVRIEGNRRIPTDTIKYRLQTKTGDVLNRTSITRDVKALYALGYFEGIRVEESAGTRGVVVVFHVEERPLIRAVKYEGLQSVTSSEIIELLRNRNIKISADSAYDPARARRAESAIKEILAARGHQNAVVSVHTEKVAPNAVAVTFEVREGAKIKVEDITIEGNNAIADGQLKRVMRQTKETGPLSLFTGNDTYSELKLTGDIERIREHYASRGFIRVNLAEPVITIKPKTVYRTVPFIKPGLPGIPIPFWKKQEQRLNLTLKIDENAQYRVGDVTVNGNKEFSTEVIRFTLGLIPGTIYDEGRLRQGLANLRNLYGSRGYISFSPVPVHNLDDGKKIVNLVLNIEEGRKFFVNRISFSGNTTTRDKVVRRELMVHEGEVFDAASWDLSLLKLNQSGFFEAINHEDAEMKLDAANSVVDIHLKLKEKDNSRIGFNGGVSGASGGFLGISYSTANFLGLGETIAVDLQGGTRQSQYQLSFTEPYLLGKPLATSFSLFSTRYQYNQTGLKLDEKRSGLSFSSSYPVRTFHRFGASYQLDNARVSALDGATQEFFSTLASGDQRSPHFFTRRLASSYTFNSTGSPGRPKGGRSLIASIETAGGFLGGNVNYYRPSFEFKAFRPVQRGRNTLAMRLTTSYVQSFGGKSVPFYERLFSGGEYDIRGFDYRSLSPIAVMSRTVDGVRYDDLVRTGGDTQAVFNLEYRIPIVGPITLAPFVDVGNSWVVNKNALRRQVTNAGGLTEFESVNLLPGTNSGLRMSTGVELQVTLPIIHLPFRMIFAYNPSRIDRTYIGPTGTPLSVQEPSRGFKFSIGKTF
jgi:outer membrane protein insertion porin family